MKIYNKKKLLSLLSWAVILCWLLLPAIVFAQPETAPPAPKQTSLEVLHDQMMSILVPVFVALIGGFATWALAKIKTRFHLDVSDKTMQQWKELAQSAAYRGAEWAREKSKGLVDGKKVPGGDVMEVAANWALQMAEHQKLPAMAREKLVGLIESELFKIRQAEAVTIATLPKPVEPSVPVVDVPQV